MKEIQELHFPKDLRYSPTHQWARLEGDIVRVGITDFAQDQLNEVVFVDLPEEGSTFNKDDEFGAVESIKSVSELYMPIGGRVTAVNPDLEDAPDLVNQDPYGKGWMLEVEPKDQKELNDLLDRNAYIEMLEGEKA